MDIQKINHFLRPLVSINNGNGYGNGNGNGNGDGDGNGNGYGYGYGNGYGYGDGDGYGNGNGYGNGDGNGNGNGDGDGYGYGNGDGNGDGYGYGYGYGIRIFNKQNVYNIDNIQTILIFIKNDLAKGFILNDDLTLNSCYIVRNDYYFSHGKTIKEALQSLENKTILDLPIHKRIENFKTRFKDYSKKVSCQLLYDWHFKLTGSCKMGRDNFIQNHNISLKSKMTITEFINLTKNSYGGEIIKQL